MENANPSDEAAAAKKKMAARSDETDRTASDDDQIPSWRARRPDIPPTWTSRHSPAEWIEAKRWFNSGATEPEKFCPIALVPGGLFETAEDVQALLGLDTVPDTIETVTMDIPGAPSIPLKYCWILRAYSVSLHYASVFANPKLVMIDGERRFVDIPLRLRDKSKLRNGKLPPYS